MEDIELSARFFTDFGLPLRDGEPERALFLMANGSTIELRPLGHPSLPQSGIEASGVREIVWGIDTTDALELLVKNLFDDHIVATDHEGLHHFMPTFGFPMALAHWQRKRVISAPDPLDAPDRISRFNTDRKWRKRAEPKVINHVVFRTAGYEDATAFIRQRLGFRLSDIQEGFDIYLRADGRNHHYDFLLLNVNAPLPGCDGKTSFDHANFGVEDIDELMIGANHMVRRGWEASRIGLGRHRTDSALFYYLPCPAGGEAEYGADTDYIDDSWVPRQFTVPLFGYAHFMHNLPDFLKEPPEWEFAYVKDE